MKGYSRRAVLGMGGAGLAGITLLGFKDWMARAQDGGQRVRYDAASPEGREMLKSYARGVAAMKAEPERSPTSWTFQWYTHWIDNATDKDAEIDRVFGGGDSDQKQLALAMWNSCRGHIDWASQADWFTPWHRMYVLFLEDMVRSASGDPDFTLPYWDYTTPGKRAIPEDFRNPSSPLFAANRNPGINEGTPLDQLPLYPQLEGSIGRDPLGLDVLDKIPFLNEGVVTGFNASLDQAPHGMVHVLVGDPSNMGSVPTAARDPIFWLHHSNVDRIWASWLAAGGGRQNPGAEDWQNKQFTFADAQGRMVLATTSDFNETAPLGYAFQSLLTPPGTAEPMAVASAEPAAARAIENAATTGEARSVTLGAEATTVELALPRPPQAMVEALAASRGQAPRVFLVLRDLRIDAQPGVLYSVFLERPDAETGENTPVLVGVINFFNALPKDLQAAGDGEHFFSFDVTDIAVEIARQGEATPQVTIAPTGTPAGEAAPVVGEVFFAQQ